MTFSEYYNALYPYLSDGEKHDVFYDSMIGHFIYEEAQEACNLLTCKPDTKRRYIKVNNPNKIKPEYAQYVYSKHYPLEYYNWLKRRMYQQDTYDRIEEWLTDNGIEFNDVCDACDNLLESIFFTIAYPNASDSSAVILPPATNTKENTSSQQLTENDKKLLKDFRIDFDSILEKCITNDQAEVWFTGRLSTEINSLYNDKWKNRIAKFEDISLQSDILSTIATLREFCNTLNPDSESIPGSSVRKLRIRLRNNYVKIHPDNYVNIFPYDAFIDDWNDGEEFFEM